MSAYHQNRHPVYALPRYDLRAEQRRERRAQRVRAFTYAVAVVVALYAIAMLVLIVTQ